MTVDLSAAARFLATHARTLDRRRFESLTGGSDADGVLAALDGYRNPDGGYGWGLEPDLRAPESQPGGALHAFEVFADVRPAVSPHAAALCDWLESVTLEDGGLPLALPIANPAGCAPFWAQVDSTASALQSTAFVAAAAHRIAAHDRAVATHPWLANATRFCFDALDALDSAPFAYVLLFGIHLLDAAYESEPEAAELLDRMWAFIPDSGLVPVDGGTADEVLRPLDFAPLPNRPVRSLFSPELIEKELRRLADGQQDDGGWLVDFESYSPAATCEWRGYRTVGALSVLRHNAII